MNYGFKNENDFVRLINNKKASELLGFISEYLIEIFKCGKNDIFTCQKYIGHYKPDVFIKCNNKKINISIKSGDSVSVHQELFEQFLFFL